MWTRLTNLRFSPEPELLLCQDLTVLWITKLKRAEKNIWTQRCENPSQYHNLLECLALSSGTKKNQLNFSIIPLTFSWGRKKILAGKTFWSKKTNWSLELTRNAKEQRGWHVTGQKKGLPLSLTPSRSMALQYFPWGSGLAKLMKNWGKKRLCCDYIQLRDFTVNGVCILLKIHESLSCLGKGKYSTRLDVTLTFS